MNRIFDVISYVMATFLAMMGILVFGNVVLRYFFNSGITFAEELSRFLFVWIIFLGAVGALKDNNHLGFTSLVQKMPRPIKILFYLANNVLVLGCLWVFFEGSLKMTILGVNTISPGTGLPLSFMYGIGVVSSVGMAIVIGYNLYKAIFVKGAIDELVVLKESEEEVAMEAKDAKGEVSL